VPACKTNIRHKHQPYSTNIKPHGTNIKSDSFAIAAIKTIQNQNFAITAIKTI